MRFPPSNSPPEVAMVVAGTVPKAVLVGADVLTVAAARPDMVPVGVPKIEGVALTEVAPLATLAVSALVGVAATAVVVVLEHTVVVAAPIDKT